MKHEMLIAVNSCTFSCPCVATASKTGQNAITAEDGGEASVSASNPEPA